MIALEQRFRYLNYMRTQLFKASLFGGTIFSPLYTEPPFDSTVVDASDLSSFWFGDSIVASFQFQKGAQNKTLTFPAGSKFVDLVTLENVTANSTHSLEIVVNTTVSDYLNFYQKAGTVVTLQVVPQKLPSVQSLYD